MDDNPTPAPVPAGWLEALARSEAELAAGLTVPGEAVRQRLHAAIARLEAKEAAEGWAGQRLRPKLADCREQQSAVAPSRRYVPAARGLALLKESASAA